MRRQSSTVDAKLADLTAGQHAINVHKSAAGLGEHVSCSSFGKGNEASLPGYSQSDDYWERSRSATSAAD